MAIDPKSRVEHTRKWNERQLVTLKKLIDSYSVIAIADISKFPSALFQKIRKRFHGKGVVKVSKSRVIKKALAENPKTAKLAEQAKENIAVIFTDLNPFELFGFVKKNKGKVAAKTGAIAEDDLVIPAGDTGLPPGPALSDLKGAGLKVAVQGASITVLEDKVVTKKGEPVSAAVAGTLAKLNIRPFKVGMRIVSALENGEVFTAQILDIDTDKVLLQFTDAHRNSFNLAVNAEVFNNSTRELLVQRAFRNTRAVALEGNVITPFTAGEILAKVQAQAGAIRAQVKEPEAAPPQSVQDAPVQQGGGQGA